LQVFLTKTHLVLAMEYAAGGDLFRYVSARRGLPEDEARWFFQQLMVAVDYCHRMVRSKCSSACVEGRKSRIATSNKP
jgi:serine/threonine protein kinase